VNVPEDVLPAERDHLVLARRELKRMREHTTALLDNQTTWGNDELTTRALAASLAARHFSLTEDLLRELHARIRVRSGREADAGSQDQ